jgi:hypothetical protein
MFAASGFSLERKRMEDLIQSILLVKFVVFCILAVMCIIFSRSIDYCKDEATRFLDFEILNGNKKKNRRDGFIAEYPGIV